jgi:serine/threonine-protein kinase
MGDLLPVLVADLDDREARDILDAAAATGGRVWVPLEAAPVNAAAHVLEVHVPSAEPFFYLAQPMGPPDSAGFPLRIKPMPDGTAPAAPRTAPARDFVQGRRSQASLSLSESHTKDLSYTGPLPTEEAQDAQLGRALAGGKLMIEQLIGRGGVGCVYKARHRELMIPVAVKVLHESFQGDVDFCRRFYAEALAASRLDHPNVTRVLDFGQEPDGQLYFAMEFLDGVELRTVLEKEKKLPTPRIASLMMQVCAGLSHAHARGIVHRDIKPENLVLVRTLDDDGSPTEVVKVCDFGIAQHRAAAAEAQGFIAGTPEYMSPEQCRSDELDARSDVYSCGVMLYELATGRVPFVADRPAQLLNRHQFTPPAPPTTVDPGVDPRLEAIILRALAKEPGARQQSMRELRAELRRLLEPAHLSPSPPTVHEATSTLELELAVSPRKPSPAAGGAGYGAPPAPAEAGGDLAASAQAWIKRLVQTTDPKAFAQATQKVEGSLRSLAQAGEVEVLWQIASTMHGIASEGQPTEGSRAWSAIKLQRVFDDPTILAQVAEQLLNGAPTTREKARTLLTNAGVAGAYGLYSARVKLARVPAVRPLFVTHLKDFGAKAWPVVKAALEKISATTAANASTFELAEDLLLCVPGAGDESAGHLVLKFLRWPNSSVCRAAAATILKLWGERAKPVFVAMLQTKEDATRVAGLAGLRQINAIDEHLLPRLEAILTRHAPAGEDVRTAAALALAHTVPTARPAALTLLTRLFTAPADLFADSGARASDGTLSKEEGVVLAVARSLLAVGGKSYGKLVTDRAERSREPLRSKLRALVTRMPSS